MNILWQQLESEVKRLRVEGVDQLYVSDEVWDQLNDWAAPSRETSAPTAADVPSPRTVSSSSPGLSMGRQFAEALAPEEKKPATAASKTKEMLAAIDASIPDPPDVSLPEGDKQAQWEWLRDRVVNCPVCTSHVKAGKKVVFGVGNLDADIFFCGEGPGADEEIQGEPFVGKAGQLLTRIIEAMGLSRESVYIGNVMNWRPEMPTQVGNRKPTEREMQFCIPYLRGQLAIVRPQVIVALGATAVDGLFGSDPRRRISSARGKWMDFDGVATMVSYHPSYVLRNGTKRTKRQIWEDMLMVMEKVGLPISEKQKGYFL